MKAQIEKSLKLKDLRKQFAKESIHVEFLTPKEMNRIYTAEYMGKERLKKWEFENCKPNKPTFSSFPNQSE